MNNLKWSSLLPLEEYLKAPNHAGVYEIGFKVSGHHARQSYTFGLNAVSYPVDFMPMYVGKSESSLRYRLGAHARAGSHANKKIREYHKERERLKQQGVQLPPAFEGLYFTCVALQEPRYFEGFVRLQYFKYPWNKKKERKAIKDAEGKLSEDLGYYFRPMATLYRDC